MDLDYSVAPAAGNTVPVDITNATGTIGPNSNVTVMVSIAAGAGMLVAGGCSGTLDFTNTTNSIGTTSRALSLTVLGPARLTVDPAQNFATSGFVGGPFDPAEQVYTLSNEGGVPLSFTVAVAGDEDFVDVTPAGGTIPPGCTG